MFSFDQDLFHMLDPNYFGDDVMLMTGETIRGSLELSPVIVNAGEATISANTHLLLVREIDIPNMEQADRLVIGNDEYSVSDLINDGTGLTQLTIHKVDKK